MALVKVSWTQTQEYEAEIEIDGFDIDTVTPQELRDAIGQLSSEQFEDAESGTSDVDITGHEVVREGDEPITVIAPRKQYEEMF